MPSSPAKLRLAVVGSRDYPRLDLVWDFVIKLAVRRPNSIIISGGARGVDTVAAAAGRLAGLEVKELIPDWGRFGNYAGFLRNSEIIDAADAVAIFWDGVSRGTMDSHKKALAAGKRVLMLGAQVR